MNESSRLIHHVAPHEHEDATGFLMRVAERNHLSGPFAILSQVLGTRHIEVHWRDIPRLAHYCRNNVEELAQLSGIVRRGPGGMTSWQVNGEWVTRSSFVARRKVKICPHCLRINAHIRGCWTLCFYSACAEHGIQMVDRCVQCGRAPRWDRPSVTCCPCGASFTDSATTPGEGPALWLAKLIAHRSSADNRLPPSAIPTNGLDQLAELSLDGLCKTVWFLGHCVTELGNYGTGHGRIQPDTGDANRMIDAALELLEDWPRRFHEALNRHPYQGPPVPSTEGVRHRFGPVEYFLHEEADTAELTFLRSAYEQHMQRAWGAHGRQSRRTAPARQLELDLH